MLALEVRVRHAPSSSAGIWQAVQGALRRQLGLQTFHRGCCRSTGVGEKLRPAAGLEGFPALSPGLGTPVLEPHLEGRREEKKLFWDTQISFLCIHFSVHYSTNTEGALIRKLRTHVERTGAGFWHTSLRTAWATCTLIIRVL